MQQVVLANVPPGSVSLLLGRHSALQGGHPLVLLTDGPDQIVAGGVGALAQTRTIRPRCLVGDFNHPPLNSGYAYTSVDDPSALR